MSEIVLTVQDEQEIELTAEERAIIEAISPTATVEKIGDTATITITDKDGTTTAEISDGEDGQDGQDGYSPKATVSKSGDTATISITDKDGTTTAEISDGEDGQDGVNAYVWIRYAAQEPTQDSDMKTTPDVWMGIYAGTSATAPTTYTSYTWNKVRGNDGQGSVTGVKMNGSLIVLDQDGIANLGTVITEHQDISGKADKVEGGTTDNFAALDANGNMKDSGHKHSDYLTSHQDISGKADKVEGGTTNNFAALDANGNLKDSGHKHSDYLAANQGGGNAGKFMRVASGGSVAYDYPSERYASISGFPATGDTNKLYIAENSGLVYVWDSTESKYMMVGGSVNEEDIAAEYDSTEIYEANEMCFHEGELYRCKDGIGSPEQWTAAHWIKTTIADELIRRKMNQSPVIDPLVSGTTDMFIATISQDVNGKITPTKKTVQDASTSAHGLMSATDKAKLDVAAPAEAVAYIVDGNKAAVSIAQGKYVTLINSSISGLSDGLYKAAQAITANTAIDSTYLTAVSGGLGEEVSSLNTQIANFGMKSKTWSLANGASTEELTTGAFIIFGVKNSSDNSNNRFCYFGTSVGENARGGYIGADVSWVGISFNPSTSKLTITNNGGMYASIVCFY